MNRLILSPLAHVDLIKKTFPVEFVISILSPRENCKVPSFSGANVLRLDFDDVGYSSDFGRAAESADILNLMKFSQDWNGAGTMLVHCRAGTSRSPAAALIALSCVQTIDFEVSATAFLDKKAYYRPNSTMLRVADNVNGSKRFANFMASYINPKRVDAQGPTVLEIDNYKY